MDFHELLSLEKSIQVHDVHGFFEIKKNMNNYEQCLHGNYRLLSTIVFSSKQLQLVVVRPPGDLFVSKVITHGLPTMAIGESRNPKTK